MSVEIKKDITTVQVEVPKTNVAVENAVTQINVQTTQPLLTIASAGVSGRDGTSGTSGTFGNRLSSSLYISGSIIPNTAAGNLTSSFSLGSQTNAWKDLWISKGTIYFIGDNNETASISINADNQIQIQDINLTGSLTASLKEGYVWVGGPENVSIIIPTSSLGGGTGAGFPYEGEAQITGSLIVTGSIFLNGVNIAGGGVGTNGTSGTSGISMTGSAGTNGTSGTSGLTITGSAGTNGTSGTSGLTITGSAGTNGTSGTSGLTITGSAGSHGTSGTSGLTITGSAGSHGTSGTSGLTITGSAGSHGTSGTSGLTITGSAGSHGTSGTSGISILADSGSFATTGSNTFYGTQILTGSGETVLNLRVNSDFPWAFTIANDTFNLDNFGNTSPSAYQFGGFIWNDGRASFGTTQDTAFELHANSQWNNPQLIISSSGVTVAKDTNIKGTLTASLAEGYIWVGGSGSKATLLATSSLVAGGANINSSSFATTGSNTFVGNQTISGALYMGSGDNEPRIWFGDGNGSVGLGMGSMTVVGNQFLGLYAGGDTLTSISLYGMNGQDRFTYGDSGGIQTQITISESGSFDLFANLGTASLLINHIPYDAHLVTTQSFNQYTSSVVATLPNGVISSSQQITNFGFVSSSTADTTLLNNFTGSIRAEVNGIEAYTASLKATTLISGAAQITALGFGAGGGDTSQLGIATASLNSYTSSNDLVRNRILQTTASLNTFTGSIRGEVNGLEAYTASLKAATLISGSGQLSGFATLTANTFVGNQIITGSLIVSSTAVSDATLLTSSSNLILNSGSNLYINNGGLAQISGSFKVTGSATINDILILTPRTTNPTNPISGSFIVSSSGDTIKPFFWDGNDWQALY
jgi:hypothetical protein